MINFIRVSSTARNQIIRPEETFLPSFTRTFGRICLANRDTASRYLIYGKFSWLCRPRRRKGYSALVSKGQEVFKTFAIVTSFPFWTGIVMMIYDRIFLISLLLGMQCITPIFCSDSDSESIPLSNRQHPRLQRMVRHHHLQEAKAHSLKGMELSTEALKRGADRSVNLNLHALVDGVECRCGHAVNKLTQSMRTSMAGLAGCTNASLISGSNTIKHLYKSNTEPKKVRTYEEHLNHVRHDHRQRQQAYNRISDQVDYIDEHH